MKEKLLAVVWLLVWPPFALAMYVGLLHYVGVPHEWSASTLEITDFVAIILSLVVWIAVAFAIVEDDTSS
ncbi:MAG: hypothetical protein A2664_03405 [Candidatus Taylorbacteria bacterium RIFCSPHIGHO2_01_FULL_46_22b]|uniref:Uncharacterized protein n=1 Tax=Candidatus Taylorbacteria bacterium RIFCSPHIGHO2_01_FULL_46_22b TaxID=1802301 RepID=A0A1G2M3L3_9BACT|nr:MAG: hypothetical protein A2664_03405 [Candidatus Taylorbacteria bacterium RIFCSPHIGHO2_01_FULL_46_22b]